MSRPTTITITITIDAGDGARVSAGGGTTAAKGTTRAHRGDSDEFIPPGGSTEPMPGKKGKDGLTIGEAPGNDLEWWSGKIESDLAQDPGSRYADSNRAKMMAMRAEQRRRADYVRTAADDAGSFDSPPPDDSDIPL